MKRFYKTAEDGTAPGGHAVRLDGKLLRTPLQKPLLLQSAALAAAIAAEWAAQGAFIVPASMPMMQYASTMLDKAEGHERPGMTHELLRYAASDLLCYFATHPSGLVARQERHWLPLLAWMAEKGAALTHVSGIRYHVQDEAALAKIKTWINGLSPAAFTIVQAMTGVTGSVILALALLENKITAEEAYQAAVVDELYQQEQWGADEAAQKRLDIIRADIIAAARFRDLAL